MEYAIIKSGGKQYKVSEGDIIEVDKLSSDKNKQSLRSGDLKDVIFENVLLLVSDSDVKIGKPTLSAKVKGKLLEDFKGEKIRVAKFKSKVRYRRVTGFRAQLSRIKIEKIESDLPPKVARKKTA